MHMASTKDKGKKRLVPTEDERTELVNPSNIDSHIYSQQQLQELGNIDRILQYQTPTCNITSSYQMRSRPQPFFDRYRPQSRRFRQYRAASSSQITQVLQTKENSIISFGNFALEKCFDTNKKFRPIHGIRLTEKQQCLLDNLWIIPTMSQASTFKLQVLNALSIYFCELSQEIPEKQQKEFTHFVIIRGIKTGIFNKWETVENFIQCPSPIFKGFYSFDEALETAEEHFGENSNFFVEPEEVKTFSKITESHPEQIIRAQRDTQYIQTQIENNLLQQREKILEEKIALPKKKFGNKEK